MPLKDHQIKDLPPAPSIKKLIGPSFILLGLGLGSGEVILWPYLTSNFGMGIIWGAILGITLQFFMNMEIERYALARGESVFVGFARKVKWLPIWFLLSTFIPWIWPGIAASSAKLIGSLFGIEETSYLAIGMLILMGLILSLGPILYKTVERFQKTLIVVGVPLIFILTTLLAKQGHWIDLAQGLAGKGIDYWFLPIGLPVASFLAAFAYSGAGGNLNLAQSFYIKEKGYGMGKYAGRITSLLTGKVEDISLAGAKFSHTPESLKNFGQWWKNINIEHFVVFWLTGSMTILLLALLSYITTFGAEGTSAGINFVLLEARAIGEMLFPLAGTAFLLVAGATLFRTQLTVFDATSRIISENVILASPDKLNEKKLPAIYYAVLWIQIFAGITVLLFGFTEPLQLLVLAAVLNAFAMFVHVGLTLWLNKTSLEAPLRPRLVRTTMMILAFILYGGFSIYTITTQFFR